ncbi:MAG: Rrf2 family transcriptional regulator [Planctomycetes bacterium]|nr:Rrf2 family transcriptional regulator [Planctomycetota bacterium]
MQKSVYEAYAGGGPGSVVDPAMLAFVKCHVTSPLTWDVLHYLAEHEGQPIGTDEIARQLHKPVTDVQRVMLELADAGVLQELASRNGAGPSYRLPPEEPSSVVLRRLMEASRRSQDLRSIVAAHLLRATHTNGKLA